jgi:hypothetical protein
MYYLKLFKTSLASLKLYSNLMKDLKKTFSVLQSRMCYMAGRPAAERVSLFLLILSAIVTTPTTVGFLRRTLDELTELISKSKQLYPKAFPGAVFRESKSTWVFPSGATIWFSYLDKDKDVTRYQGQAFNWIAIDEITQYPTPMYGNIYGPVYVPPIPNSPKISRCAVQPTPAVLEDGGSKNVHRSGRPR